MMNTSTLNQIKPEQNNVFAGLNFLEVDEKSKVPKYMQIVDIILSDIENGIFNIGEQIPSINETSCEFYMARDTVEKAYKILKEKGIITAVKGKGYFVSSTADICNKRILLLLNHFESENKTIYNTFYENLPEGTEIDLYVYNGQPELLEKCIIKSLGAYDYFIILPVLDTHTKDLDNAIKKIPGNKLISIRHELSSAQHAISALVQDDCKNIEEAMNSIKTHIIPKYKRFHCIFPKGYEYSCIWNGFKKFGQKHNVPVFHKSEIDDTEVNKGDFFLIKEDQELATLIKKCDQKQLEIGQDVGVVCYNDNSIKEILRGGITVFTPDYVQMGETLATIINDKRKGHHINNFNVIVRNSI